MKTTALTFFICMYCLSSLSGQSSNDSLFVKKFLPGKARIDFDRNNLTEKMYYTNAKNQGFYIYSRDNKYLPVSSVERLMKSDELAYKKLKSAKSLAGARDPVTYMGMAGLLIYVLVSPPAGEDTKENVKSICIIFGSLLGMLIIDSSLKSAAYKKVLDAAIIYNNNLSNLPKPPVAELKIGLTGNGIGMRINF